MKNILVELQARFFELNSIYLEQTHKIGSEIKYTETVVRKFHQFLIDSNNKGLIQPPINDVNNLPEPIYRLYEKLQAKIKSRLNISIRNAVELALIEFGFKKLNTVALSIKHDGIEYQVCLPKLTGDKFQLKKLVADEWKVVVNCSMSNITFDKPIKITKWCEITPRLDPNDTFYKSHLESIDELYKPI